MKTKIAKQKYKEDIMKYIFDIFWGQIIILTCILLHFSVRQPYALMIGFLLLSYYFKSLKIYENKN